MEQREAITALFDLPRDEEIYEDFTCQFISGINPSGKLYCCENYICFAASVVGVSVKRVTKVGDIEQVVKGDDWFEIRLKKEKEGKDRMLRYAKFQGGREAAQRAIRLVIQIVGEDKLTDYKKEIEKDSNEKTPNDKNQVENQTFNDVIFDNFFGPEVKEILRVQMPIPAEKFCQILLGPKTPIMGFEVILPAVGMEYVRSDNWEENPKVGSFTRKFVYNHRRMDNIYLNREIIEQVQTYSLKQ